MATTSEPRTHSRSTGEQRFVLHGIGWDAYETLLKLLSDRPIRLTYDRGNLELMSPSMPHEQYSRLMGFLIQSLCEELEIPCIVAGSTTFRREIKQRGLEPDECFYLSNAERMIGRHELDLAVDPPPDLAIEIDITHSSLDRIGIYAALGVPEVWRFDGETLSVLTLQPDGTYAASAQSPCFPFLPLSEVVRWLKLSETMDHSRWGRQFRAWVREQIVPRVRPGGEVG